jgi:uncharacterized damage-inducible protein DinB
MINQSTAGLLSAYKTWADQLTFDAVAALPPAELVRERPTLFKTIVGTLNHSYVVDLIWQAHLEGRAHGFTARNSIVHADLGVLWAAQQTMNSWLLAWSDAQSDATLGETVQFRFVSGKHGSMTRGEILMHIVTHATYHRGWVSDLFYQVPAKPPTTDLCVFLCDASAQRPRAAQRSDSHGS